jgi:hypothetical protein
VSVQLKDSFRGEHTSETSTKVPEAGWGTQKSLPSPGALPVTSPPKASTALTSDSINYCGLFFICLYTEFCKWKS